MIDYMVFSSGLHSSRPIIRTGGFGGGYHGVGFGGGYHRVGFGGVRPIGIRRPVR